ncbi:MAG: hypothetical protein LBU83_05680 [Bacteroidales bacterium]|jgi:hypothetical protein|nr:hypothetical protein [Bacteroidales bacterium]
MEDYNWYEIFIDSLYERFPKKSQLAQEIMNLLCLEREAVYRRLRKDVMFTFQEISKMAAAWNVSLDEIMGINIGKVTFQMTPMNYLVPTKKELINLKRKVKLIEHLSDSFNSEFMEVSNRIPRPLSTSFMILYRFEIFRWAYQYHNDEALKQFDKIILPTEVSFEINRYNKYVKHVTETHLLLDEMVFEYLVNNILYFHSILLISDKDKEKIKEALYSLLDYLMLIASDGRYPETQKKVNLYISQINIDTNYSYFYTEQFKACRVHAFGKYDISTYELEMISLFKNLMHLKKRASIQISEVNEKSRIEYFMKQRKLVDSL